MRARCHSTVRTLRWTRSAISRLVCPRASSARISRSRRLSLSGGGASGSAGRGRHGGPLGVEAEGDHVGDRLDQPQLAGRERADVPAPQHDDLADHPPARPHRGHELGAEPEPLDVRRKLMPLTRGKPLVQERREQLDGFAGADRRSRSAPGGGRPGARRRRCPRRPRRSALRRRSRDAPRARPPTRRRRAVR